MYGPGGQGWSNNNNMNTGNGYQNQQGYGWNNNFNTNQGNRIPEWYYNSAHTFQTSMFSLFSLFLCLFLL
jgi:hypothetical protein